MINKIELFHPILLNLNNYNKENKQTNKDTIVRIHQLLLDKTDDISDKTYEWQCYLLIMFNQVIKELINENDSSVTYEQFRSNLLNSFRPGCKYEQLNQSVLSYYPQVVINEDLNNKKEDNFMNANEEPNIYYDENISSDNSSSSLIIYEEIEIDEVKEISNTDEASILKIEQSDKEEQLKQQEYLKEQNYNANSQAFIQQTQKESQQKNQNSDLQQPQQQQKLPQSISPNMQYNIKSKYIIDSNTNDLTRRIDELIEKINTFDSVISFIRYTANSNEASISTLLHNNLSLIPNKKTYDNISINKIITLLALFFPFLTENQKNSNLDRLKSMIAKQERIAPLLTNLFFIPTEKENRQFITDIVCNAINKKEINHEIINKRIQSIQTLDDIKELFIVQLLLGVINTNQDNAFSIQLELSLANISFMMSYIFKNEKLFPMLNTNQLLLDCFIIKKVYECYKISFDELVSVDCEKSINILFNNEKLIKAKDDMSINEYQSFVIDESIMERYESTLSFIKHFYVINDSTIPRLISNKNLSFVLGNHELQFIKSRLIYNNLFLYRQMLIRLEGSIYQISQDTFNHSLPIFSYFSIPKSVKNTFNTLQSNLKKKFPSFNFTLYPFGSITQFISSNDSDLDVYLDLNAIAKDNRVFFVKRLFNYIQVLDHKAFNRNSFRICLISFTFKGLKIDLSCLALCPYLHSNVIRCYSLMDSRFPILAICLKKLLSILNLKNDNLKNSTLNSFCWTMLLIVFLQDIISPPVLPKLLMNSKYVGKLIEIGGGKPKNVHQQQKQSNRSNYYRKTIHQVFENTSFHYIEVSPDSFGDYEEIYNDHIKEKNMMSLSELFLKFLEFVIFLFKYDTIFPSFTFFNECYMNKSSIKEQINDYGLRRFYFTRYLTNPKGDILFREPFDYNYNPGQSIHNASELVEKLKKAYLILIENGSFEALMDIRSKNGDLNNDENNKVNDADYND